MTWFALIEKDFTKVNDINIVVITFLQLVLSQNSSSHDVFISLVLTPILFATALVLIILGLLIRAMPHSPFGSVPLLLLIAILALALTLTLSCYRFLVFRS